MQRMRAHDKQGRRVLMPMLAGFDSDIDRQWAPGDYCHEVSLGGEGGLLVVIYHDDETKKLSRAAALNHDIWEFPKGDGIIRKHFLTHNEACFGNMRLLGISRGRAVLLCDSCYLRINFPASIRTFKEFEEFIATNTLL